MEEKQDKINEELELIKKDLGLINLDEAIYFPKFFEIETIRACNARCKMCTINEWKDKNNKMSEELFFKILNEMNGYGSWIERVCLSRNGEPLLDKNIVEKIKRLKEIGIKYITFSTNGSLLTKEKSIEIIESGLDDIRFSIDGFTKETFENIRKGLNFEQVINNCLEFIELRNQRGKKPVVHIRMVLQEENVHEEEDFKKFWLSKVLDTDVVSSKPMHSWGNQLSNYEESSQSEEYAYLPCISPWSTMIIHFDGKVPLCGCDYNNKKLMGDLKKNSIKEIWASENFQKIREQHSSGKRKENELCNGCNIWDAKIKKIYR